MYMIYKEGDDLTHAKQSHWDYGNDEIPAKGDVFFPSDENYWYVVDSRQYHQGHWIVDGVNYYVRCLIYLEKRSFETC